MKLHTVNVSELLWASDLKKIDVRFETHSLHYGNDSKSKTLPSASHTRTEKSPQSRKSENQSNFGTFPRKKKERTSLRTRYTPLSFLVIVDIQNFQPSRWWDTSKPKEQRQGAENEGLRKQWQ